MGKTVPVVVLLALLAAGFAWRHFQGGASKSGEAVAVDVLCQGGLLEESLGLLSQPKGSVPPDDMVQQLCGSFEREAAARQMKPDERAAILGADRKPSWQRIAKAAHKRCGGEGPAKKTSLGAGFVRGALEHCARAAP